MLQDSVVKNGKKIASACTSWQPLKKNYQQAMPTTQYHARFAKEAALEGLQNAMMGTHVYGAGGVTSSRQNYSAAVTIAIGERQSDEQ